MYFTHTCANQGQNGTFGHMGPKNTLGVKHDHQHWDVYCTVLQFTGRRMLQRHLVAQVHRSSALTGV